MNPTHSGLQVVPSEYSDLQVVADGGPQVVENEKFPISNEPPCTLSVHETSKICGFKRRTFWIILIVLIVILATALGGGLGGGLSKSQSSSQRTTTTASSPSGSNSPSSHTASEASPTSTSAPSLSTTTVELPTVTLLRDCPSSNYTIHSIDAPTSSSPDDALLFRKICSASFRHDINGRDVVNVGRIRSLNDCIRECVDYNVANATQIALGNNQTCNAVCWRNDQMLESNLQIPGQCFGFTARNTTVGGFEVTQDEVICDSAIWINQRNL